MQKLRPVYVVALDGFPLQPEPPFAAGSCCRQKDKRPKLAQSELLMLSQKPPTAAFGEYSFLITEKINTIARWVSSDFYFLKTDLEGKRKGRVKPALMRIPNYREARSGTAPGRSGLPEEDPVELEHNVRSGEVRVAVDIGKAGVASPVHRSAAATQKGAVEYQYDVGGGEPADAVYVSPGCRTSRGASSIPESNTHLVGRGGDGTGYGLPD
jgi:hypothetical protein